MNVLTATLVAAAVVEVVYCGLQVVTEGGRIQGIAESTFNGRLFNSFYSLPYARAPIGDYRFKDPVKPLTWHRLANASHMPPPCMQVPFLDAMLENRLKPEEVHGSENCLFLNVFTPETGSTPEKVKLPVLVWLHGGGFFSGGAEEYFPHSFLDHDIVLVVVQYRLGVLGFLSTEDSVMPGNLGLKDQTMALKWVQNNIYLFGGDKTQVTIFGESAGSASVHYHMLTPHSRGLFSQVIMQSGSMLSNWAWNNQHRGQAENLGRSMECEDPHNSTALLICLQKVDAKDLTAHLQDTFEWLIFPFYYGPRVDGDYIPDLPAKLIANKQYADVNLMSGITREEGGIITRAMSARQSLITQLESDLDTLGSIILFTNKEKNSQALTRTLLKHYMDEAVLFDEVYREQFTKLLTDIQFSIDHDEVTMHHAVHFPGRKTFRYQFDYLGGRSISNIFGTEIGKNWVVHSDDLLYLFTDGPVYGAVPETGLTEPDDIRVRNIMLKMWVNFATSGNPTPDNSFGFRWEPSTANNLKYLSITPSPSMQPDNRKEIRDFMFSLPISKWSILHPENKQQQQHEHQQQQQQENNQKEHLHIIEDEL